MDWIFYIFEMASIFVVASEVFLLLSIFESLDVLCPVFLNRLVRFTVVCMHLAEGAKSRNFTVGTISVNGPHVQICYHRLYFVRGRYLPNNRANMSQRLFEPPVSGKDQRTHLETFF